jgi:hypothetical protein
MKFKIKTSNTYEMISEIFRRQSWTHCDGWILNSASVGTLFAKIKQAEYLKY